MGEAVFWALDSQIRGADGQSLASAPVGGAQVAITLERDDFVAAVEKELRQFSYSRPHHVTDFRIACSCDSILCRDPCLVREDRALPERTRGVQTFALRGIWGFAVIKDRARFLF